MTDELKPAKYQWRSRIKGGAWDAWENGRFGQEVPPFIEVEERKIPKSEVDESGNTGWMIP